MRRALTAGAVAAVLVTLAFMVLMLVAWIGWPALALAVSWFR